MADSHYEGLLNKTVARYTRTISSNAFGEDEETWAYNESGIKCRLVRIPLEELKSLPGKYDNVEYRGFFLSTQTLTTDDEIHYNDNIFNIKQVCDDSSGYVRSALLGYKP